MVHFTTLTRPRTLTALCLAVGSTLATSFAAPALAAPCVSDVALLATNETKAPALAGYQLAGYWDVAGEGVGGTSKGQVNMGLFYTLSDDPSKCLQTLCLKASDVSDPKTPAGYERAGMWDADAGGSWGLCGLNVAGAAREATRGGWMLGLYERTAKTPGAMVIESLRLTASDVSTQATLLPGYEAVAYWDVDRGGAFGAQDQSKGSYMMTLSVKLASPPATTVAGAPAAPSTASAGVDGRNVTWVKAHAVFQRISRTQWVELGADGSKKYQYSEQRRDESSVYLYDYSRAVALELNLKTKQIRCCSETASKNHNLSQITSAQTGFVADVTKTIAAPGNYFRIRLKSDPSYYLRAWSNGIGSDKVNDDSSKWILIPTGINTDEYWIFNKSANASRGAALSRTGLPNVVSMWWFESDAQKSWQRFKVQFTSNGYFRLIEQSSDKALSTRLDGMSFVWDVNPTDSQQEFMLESAGEFGKDDTLPGYLFWNFGNERIKSYFADYLKKIPQPSLLNLKKLVFVNASSRKVAPAVHHVGCAGAPWRAGNPQCWYKELGPDESVEFPLDDYVKNASAIWAAVGAALAITAGVAISIACVGFCAPAIAAAISPGAATAASFGSAAASGSAFVSGIYAVKLGVELTTALVGVVDFAILSWAPQALVENIKELSNPTEISIGEVTKDIGASAKAIPIIRAHLGDHAFVARNEVYRTVTTGFYIEETAAKKENTTVYYADGTVLMIFE